MNGNKIGRQDNIPVIINHQNTFMESICITRHGHFQSLKGSFQLTLPTS